MKGNLLRKILNWLFIVAVVVLSYIFWFRAERALHAETFGDVTCEFTAQPGQPVIRLGEYRAPLQRLSVKGTLSDPFMREKFDFRGRGEYVIEGAAKSADVKGSVFVDEAGGVLGLFLVVEDQKFGHWGKLNVLTLNEQGILDYSDERAYAYASREWRMSHPLDMKCSIEGFRPPPENQATPS